MPFQPSSLPSQIAAARREELRTQGAPGMPFKDGSAQRAKESAARWSRSGMRDPQVDSAPPWFSGAHPFSQVRFDNARNFDDWKGRFLNETDMGASFAPPPPPEPALPPADQKSGVA